MAKRETNYTMEKLLHTLTKQSKWTTGKRQTNIKHPDD